MWNDWITKRYTALSTIRTRSAKLNHLESRILKTKNQTYLNFISNDYLGLANNPKLVKVLSNSASMYGIGSTGAATMGGYTTVQEQLQIELAKWLKFDQCLIFNSGYQLDSTLYSQLTDNNTIIWFDKRCHASHIDGIRLAQQVNKTKFYSFSPSTIDQTIQKIASQPNIRHIVLSEGIFSMDGTCTYLEKLINLRSTYNNVLLIIDDAHGIGAIGINGYGSLEQYIDNTDNHNFEKNIDLLIGTMSKTFGTHGGFICGQQNIINYLAQVVRGQLFTTCLPPCILAASQQSLEIIKSNEGQTLRAQLAKNVILFQQLCKKYSLPLLNSDSNTSPIQLLGFATQDSLPINNFGQRIKEITKRLLDAGIYVGMMCYPTVAKNMPRIRISLNSAHTNEDIGTLCENLKDFI